VDTSQKFAVASHAYANRGLHGPGAPENSLPAFRAAAAAGLGACIDVKITRDNRLVAFHDHDLRRMCGALEWVMHQTLGDLIWHSLPGGLHIPTLEQALDAMAGLPVLLHLKIDNPRERKMADVVAETLKAHPGPAAVISGDVSVLKRLVALTPERPIGPRMDTVMNHFLADPASHARWRESFAHFDFWAPHVKTLKAVAGLADGKIPLAAWAITRQVDLDFASRFKAAPIFEGFSPDLANASGNPI
jgi:glycerophosphoryl diester phosphodiesterase